MAAGGAARRSTSSSCATSTAGRSRRRALAARRGATWRACSRARPTSALIEARREKARCPSASRPQVRTEIEIDNDVSQRLHRRRRLHAGPPRRPLHDHPHPRRAGLDIQLSKVATEASASPTSSTCASRTAASSRPSASTRCARWPRRWGGCRRAPRTNSGDEPAAPPVVASSSTAATTCTAATAPSAGRRTPRTKCRSGACSAICSRSYFSSSRGCGAPCGTSRAIRGASRASTTPGRRVATPRRCGSIFWPASATSSSSPCCRGRSRRSSAQLVGKGHRGAAAPAAAQEVIERRIRERLGVVTKLDPVESSRRAREVLVANAPRTMAVLVPIFALLVMMLFWRRFFVEHLVFALHAHALAYCSDAGGADPARRARQLVDPGGGRLDLRGAAQRLPAVVAAGDVEDAAPGVPLPDRTVARAAAGVARRNALVLKRRYVKSARLNSAASAKRLPASFSSACMMARSMVSGRSGRSSRGGARRLGQVREADRDRVVAGERRPPGDQVVRERAERVDVGARVDAAGRAPARAPCSRACP